MSDSKRVQAQPLSAPTLRATPSSTENNQQCTKEKKAIDDADVSVDDAQMAKEVEEFEERLQNDEAAEEEYLVQEAYEVAIKVSSPLDIPYMTRILTFIRRLGLVDQGRTRAPGQHFPNMVPRSWFLGFRSVSSQVCRSR